jgi:hypothetical protein
MGVENLLCEREVPCGSEDAANFCEAGEELGIWGRA